MKDLINRYYNNPVGFVREIIEVEPNHHQLQVLNSLPVNHRLAVRSGNGCGKTALEVWVMLWFMSTHPNCRVVCTAPTQHQLFDVLWAELKKWLNNCILREYLGWTATSLFNKKQPDTWFAVARSSNESVNFQGFHEENILFIVDEASGVSDDIWEAIRGSLTTKNSFVLLCGNPNFLSGFYYRAFHKNATDWTRFHFSGLDSQQVRPEFIQEIINDFGLESNQYRIRVLGEFPLEENSDLYIPLSLLQPSIFAKGLIWDSEPDGGFEYDLGVDIARFGDDETVMAISKHNMRYYEHKTIDVSHLISLSHKPLTEVAGFVINLHRKWNFKNIYVDETGLGAGVYDMLKEAKLPVIPITFGGKMIATIKDTNKEAMYKSFKLLLEKQAKLKNDQKVGLRSGVPDILRLPDLPKLVTQFVSLHFEYSSSGVLMVHHEDGGHDDIPDAVCLSLFRYVLNRKKGSYAIA